MSSIADAEFQRMKTEMGCSVIKQLVSLDIGWCFIALISLGIDVENRLIKGCTELCIVPHGRGLKDIRLNCRQCEIDSVFVNDV